MLLHGERHRTPTRHKDCPRCKGQLKNVPRSAMTSSGYKRKDGTVAQHTHTYDCADCYTRFEIDQNR